MQSKRPPTNIKFKKLRNTSIQHSKIKKRNSKVKYLKIKTKKPKIFLSRENNLIKKMQKKKNPKLKLSQAKKIPTRLPKTKNPKKITKTSTKRFIKKKSGQYSKSKKQNLSVQIKKKRAVPRVNQSNWVQKLSKKLFDAACNKNTKYINNFIGTYQHSRIKLNFDLQDRDHFRLTHFAIYYNIHNLVDYLVHKNVSFDHQTKQGVSCLMLAVIKKNKRFTQLLAAKTADINVQDSLGNTALHYAVTQGDLELVKILLGHFADPKIKNHKKQTIVNLAHHSIIFGLQKLLFEHQNQQQRNVNNIYRKWEDSDFVEEQAQGNSIKKLKTRKNIKIFKKTENKHQKKHLVNGQQGGNKSYSTSISNQLLANKVQQGDRMRRQKMCKKKNNVPKSIKKSSKKNYLQKKMSKIKKPKAIRA